MAEVAVLSAIGWVIAPITKILIDKALDRLGTYTNERRKKLKATERRTCTEKRRKKLVDWFKRLNPCKSKHIKKESSLGRTCLLIPLKFLFCSCISPTTTTSSQKLCQKPPRQKHKIQNDKKNQKKKR